MDVAQRRQATEAGSQHVRSRDAEHGAEDAKPRHVPATRRSSIILLNGPSSAGKSSLCRALVPLLESPFLHLSSDQLIQSGILPPLDAAARDGEWAWARFAPRFFAGYHRAVAGFAAAGNHAVVEHVLISQHWYEDCLRVWSEFDVFFVGVQCALTELEARERARGDRAIGTAREHVEQGVHARGEYDLVIDTSQGAVAEHAARIRSAFGARPRPSSFERALRRRCP